MELLRARIVLLLLLAGISSAGFADAITGYVLSADGLPLANARIELDGRSATTNEDGLFAIAAAAGPIQRLHFSADGHFPMVHSFSDLDFAAFAGREIPPVTLVRRAEGRIMLAFGGDAMMGRRFSRPNPGEPVLIREEYRAVDTLALLRHIRPYLELADYTSVNLETQILSGQPEGSAPKSFVFYSPPETLQALEASGVDYVTLGNNHTFDYLAPGLDSTIAALDASGLGWSGAGRTKAESLKAHRVSLEGNPLGFLGYVGWAGNFSPNQVATGVDKGGAAYGAAENVRASVRREADQGFLPIVQYHGSREYTDEPTLATETRLKQAIDEGAIIAIAHHPHVVQGFEIYDGRLIAYSMGNFIFDQVDYATHRSYLVYVWMDRDRLHRAEIMPLHIKGYVPVPATDSVRWAILRRVHELSGRRGIELQVSGGHGVIVPGTGRTVPAKKAVYTRPDEAGRRSATVWPLAGQPWWEPLQAIGPRDGGDRSVLLGRDLLPNGHFESHHSFDAPDRSWIADGAQSVVALESAPSGRHVMQLEIAAGAEHGRVGMRTFERTFVPGTPTTFVARARVDGAAGITAHQQWRKRDDKLWDALENARLRPIGRVELEPGAWQEIRFDFDSPRVTAVAYRIVLTVEPLETDRHHTSWFDDLSLIEWLGPPLTAGEIPPHVPTGQASHAGLPSR
jgi:poly-gamma-glutamate capsule biosynthesis protein CapA/YwtB (metallophosphatase superfamily)